MLSKGQARALFLGDTFLFHAAFFDGSNIETDGFFPAMFTPDHFSKVPRPRALTTSLCDLFVKLRAHV